MELNKQLQNKIGSIIGKDYFKLGWGCKVIDDYGEAILNKSYKKMSGSNDLYEGKNSRGNTVITHIKEIIGFEPTLNDVLLAISQKNPCIVRIPRITENTLIELARKEDDVKISYNLEKSIFNQSDETKSAIINLLNSEEVLINIV